MANSDYSSLLNLPGTTPFFAVTALRDLMLPELLGTEQHHILYWAGRDLASKVPVAETDIETLFQTMGFGTLTLSQSNARARSYELSGELVSTRIKTYDAPDFQLEAGFLAQALQQALGYVVEANSEIKGHEQTVTFTVALDQKTAQPLADQFYSLQ